MLDLLAILSAAALLVLGLLAKLAALLEAQITAALVELKILVKVTLTSKTPCIVVDIYICIHDTPLIVYIYIRYILKNH